MGENPSAKRRLPLKSEPPHISNIQKNNQFITGLSILTFNLLL
jgi:hypothetical protein